MIMDDQNFSKNMNLDNIVLALLFAADEPVSVRRMSSILEDVDGAEIKTSLEGWRKRFDDESWSIAVEQVAGGYQVATRSDYAPFVGRLYSKKRKLRLSRAGMETLAIIAYKQPVTRADIENVRGVGSGGVVANLMERSLIKITGKARVLGAPFLYGTTTEFLEYLGLNSLKDLPSLDELEALLEKEAYPEAAVESLEDSEESTATVAAPEPATISAEESDELYEATAAEVASAMAAVSEATFAMRPKPEPPVEQDANEDKEPVRAGEPRPDDPSPPSDAVKAVDSDSTQAPALAEVPAPAAAVLGPSIDEPMNRPAGPLPEVSADEAGEPDTDPTTDTEPPVTPDERDTEL